MSAGKDFNLKLLCLVRLSIRHRKSVALLAFLFPVYLHATQFAVLRYDAAGNFVADGRKQLAYDAQNKTIAFSDSQNAGSYLYKDSGSRLRKRFSLTSNPGQTTELINPTRLMTLQQKPGVGRGAVQHIYLNGIRIAALGPDATGQPGIRYYHTDHVSSVKLVTDGKADVVQRHEYLPYGGEFTLPSPRQWGGAGGGVPKFNSQEHDKESGLDFFNARHYDAALAHFTSADTVIAGEENLAGWNRYMFVWANPVRYADPSGNNPIWWAFYRNNHIRLIEDKLGYPVIKPHVSVGKPTDDYKLYDLLWHKSVAGSPISLQEFRVYKNGAEFFKIRMTEKQSHAVENYLKEYWAVNPKFQIPENTCQGPTAALLGQLAKGTPAGQEIRRSSKSAMELMSAIKRIYGDSLTLPADMVLKFDPVYRNGSDIPGQLRLKKPNAGENPGGDTESDDYNRPNFD